MVFGVEISFMMVVAALIVKPVMFSFCLFVCLFVGGLFFVIFILTFFFCVFFKESVYFFAFFNLKLEQNGSHLFEALKNNDISDEGSSLAVYNM